MDYRTGEVKLCVLKEDVIEDFYAAFVPIEPEPCCENCKYGADLKNESLFKFCQELGIIVDWDFYCKYWEREE